MTIRTLLCVRSAAGNPILIKNGPLKWRLSDDIKFASEEGHGDIRECINKTYVTDSN